MFIVGLYWFRSFFVPDLVFVLKNQMKNKEHEHGTKNKNNTNLQDHWRNNKPSTKEPRTQSWEHIR